MCVYRVIFEVFKIFEIRRRGRCVPVWSVLTVRVLCYFLVSTFERCP
jgi:hypothetical protein